MHLQIGYRSTLRGSQSISDLSNVHDNHLGLPHRPSSSTANGSRGKGLKNSTKSLTHAQQDSCTAPNSGPTSTTFSNGTHNLHRKSLVVANSSFIKIILILYFLELIKDYFLSYCFDSAGKILKA